MVEYRSDKWVDEGFKRTMNEAKVFLLRQWCSGDLALLSEPQDLFLEQLNGSTVPQQYYLDDQQVARPGPVPTLGIECDAYVQRFLFEHLTRLEYESLDRLVDSVLTHPGLRNTNTGEEPPTGCLDRFLVSRFASKSQLIDATIQTAAAKGFKHMLYYLVAFERLTMNPAYEPGCAYNDHNQIMMVTSGRQDGLGTAVSQYNAYWKRFLESDCILKRTADEPCLIDLGYVAMLCPNSSLLGFLMAASESAQGL